MANEETIQIPQNITKLHSKGLAALERNNTDIAINIFLRCVQQCPGFLAARRNLRLTEIASFKAANKHKSLTHHLSSLMGAVQMMKVKGLEKSGKLEEALVACEQLLLMDPLNLSFVKTFAGIAIAAGYSDAGVMTAELVCQNLPPDDMTAVEMLGRLYFTVKDYRKARECLERVHRVRPQDAQIASMLKNSEALGTLDSGWEEAHEQGNYRKVLANQEQAEKLEQASKMVKTADDADTLIAEAWKKVEAEPKNVNYYLNLVGLYQQQKRFDEALQTIDRARELVGADAELDRRYSAIRIAKYEADVAALREVGDAAGAEAMEAEQREYVFQDIFDRAQRYPNDQHLRYELGIQYYLRSEFDSAIQQLQIAQKNPKDRVSALFHMALCFREKGLLDMAVSQLEQALEFVVGMTTEKLEIYYLLGEISLEEGKLDDAAKFFKEVYKVDVTYRDIAKHIENIYAAQRQAKQG